MVKVAFYIHMAKALGEHKGLIASPTNDYLYVLKVCCTFRHSTVTCHMLLPLNQLWSVAALWEAHCISVAVTDWDKHIG